MPPGAWLIDAENAGDDIDRDEGHKVQRDALGKQHIERACGAAQVGDPKRELRQRRDETRQLESVAAKPNAAAINRHPGEIEEHAGKYEHAAE